MIEKHEDLGVLNELASQQKYASQSFDLYKEEMTKVLNAIIDSHNEIKQEVFIVRQNQVTDKKIVSIENDLSTKASVPFKAAELEALSSKSSEKPSFSSPVYTSSVIKPKPSVPHPKQSNSVAMLT